jgi:5-methylcytosine-specific restriction enzyme subunit McrC
MPETIRNRLQNKQVIACEYDELSENNLLNQILKTTLDVLLRSSGVKAERKAALKRVLLFFDGIRTLDPRSIQWNRITIRRNNKSYEMLLNICYFVLDGLLQSTDKGGYRMAQFSDDHMARLYERFVLEYFRHHHKELSATASQIKWKLSDESDEAAIKFLPVMQTDIMLKSKNRLSVMLRNTGHRNKLILLLQMQIKQEKKTKQWFWK